jgi:hypothetical protein
MEYEILLNILVGLMAIIVIWVLIVPKATKESFQSALRSVGYTSFGSEPFIGIGPEPPGEVKVAPVAKADAMQQIQKNLDQEIQLLKDLEPYYEKLVQIAAGAKVTDPSAPDFKAQAEKKKPEVRQEIENETSGACIPLHDIMRALEAIKANTQLTPEAKLVISYKILPASVESYRTTIVYLNKKALELYKYFTELGGKGSPTTAVQGSSANSMNIKIDGFVSGSAAEDITLNSAAVQAKGSVSTIIAAYLKQEADKEMKAAPITDKTIQDLYGISNTRIRLFTEYDLRGPLFLDTKNNFDRLNSLMEQVQNPPDTVYAGITEGKSPQAALEGFLERMPRGCWLSAAEQGPTEDNYAFLKY